MADSKITNLTAVTTPADTDELVVQQSGDSAAKKLTRTQLLADHVAATTSVHGITAAGAALIDDATAGDQRTTLGLGTAATSNTGDFEAAGAVSTHSADTTSVHGITDTSALLDTGDIGVSVAAEGHTHTLSDVTDSGTAAALNVSASGDAASGEVVKGDDTRLTDARTPTSHNHAGEDITSGTVAAARLGTMTGDSGAGGASGAAPAPGAGDAAAGKYLKADGTWATVSAGVGGSTGATDNAILRADGTGGATVQAGSNVFLSDSAGGDMVQFEGKTSSFPALSRLTSTAYLAARLADDSDFTRIISSGFWVESSPKEVVGTFSGISGIKVASDRFFSWHSGTSNVHLAGSSLELGQTAGSLLVSTGIGTIPAPVLSSTLVEANTATSGAPNVIAATESGTTFTNEGATAANYHTLPSAAAGLRARFRIQDSDGMRIVAASGDTIRVLDKVTAAAGYVESTTIGSYVELEAINGTEWHAGPIGGTWTDGTFTYDDTSLTTP